MILTTIALVAQATPAATATPDAAVAETAKSWFMSLQHGKVLDDQALTKDMLAVFTPAVLSASVTKFGPYGDPTSVDQKKTGTVGGHTYYQYDFGFQDGKHVTFIISFDESGKISGMRAIPQ